MVCIKPSISLLRYSTTYLYGSVTPSVLNPLSIYIYIYMYLTPSLYKVVAVGVGFKTHPWVKTPPNNYEYKYN
jgi:hypothetical protein